MRQWRTEAVAAASPTLASQLVSAPAGAWEQLLHLKRMRQLIIHSVNRPKQVTCVPACSGQKHVYISHENRLRTSSNPSSCTGIAHTSLHVDEHTSASLVQQLHTTTLYLPLSLTELLTPAGWLCRPALYIQGASQPSWDRHRSETCVKQAGLVLKFLTCSFKSSLLSGKSFWSSSQE